MKMNKALYNRYFNIIGDLLEGWEVHRDEAHWIMKALLKERAFSVKYIPIPAKDATGNFTELIVYDEVGEL